MDLLKFCSVLSAVFLCVAPVGRAALVIGGFNNDRIGIGNVSDGPIVEEFRSAVSEAWPGATFVGTSLLNPTFLDAIDVLVIGAPMVGGVTYLSPQEQQYLLDYIKGGGGAIIFADNDDHAGVPASDDAAETFLDPFGVDATGHLDGPQLARSPEGVEPHPLLQGPFGQVSFIGTSHGGWFNGFGPYAAPVARYDNNGEAAVLAIPRDTLSSIAGGVVFLGDADMLVDSGDGGFFGDQDNRTLVLNSIEYVIPEPSVALTAIVGAAVFLSRRQRGRRSGSIQTRA